jgi:hypothetical protein
MTSAPYHKVEQRPAAFSPASTDLLTTAELGRDFAKSASLTILNPDYLDRVLKNQKTFTPLDTSDLTPKMVSISQGGGGDPSKFIPVIRSSGAAGGSKSDVGLSGSAGGLSGWGIALKAIAFVGLVFAVGYVMYHWKYSAVKL